MADIRIHDIRIKNLGINTLLKTPKHPLKLEEEFENLTEEWPAFEFEKKKPFRYHIHVLIDRPKVNEDSDGEEEESKGQDRDQKTEEVKVGLRMDIT